MARGGTEEEEAAAAAVTAEEAAAGSSDAGVDEAAGGVGEDAGAAAGAFRLGRFLWVLPRFCISTLRACSSSSSLESRSSR